MTTFLYDKVRELRFANADDRYSKLITGYYTDLQKAYNKHKVGDNIDKKAAFEQQVALPYLTEKFEQSDGDERDLLSRIIWGQNEEQEYGDYAHIDDNEHIFGVENQRINFASSGDMSMAFRYSYVANTINKKFLGGEKKRIDILDIGCSKGTFYSFWRTNFQPVKKPSISYLGVDIRKKVIDYCKDKLENPEKFVEFKQMDIMKEELPSDKKYDAILFMEIIEHIPVEDGKRMLAKCHELLADDGIIFISSPNPKKHLGQMLTNPAAHIYEYTLDEMRDLLNEYGFETLDITGWFGRSRYIKEGLTEAEREIYDAATRLGSGLRMAIFSFLKPERAECYTFCCRKAKTPYVKPNDAPVEEVEAPKSIIDF